MRHTIVALFDTYVQAEEARDTLVRSGFARSDIELQAQPEPTADTAATEPPGVLASIERFLSSLFTSNRDPGDMQRYTEAVRRGAVIVSVRAASESHAELACNALTQLGALDIGEREAGWDAAPADPDARRAHSVLDELGLGSPVPPSRQPLPADDAPVARDTLPADEVPPSSALTAAPGIAPNDDLAAQAAFAAAGAPGAGAVMGSEGPPTDPVGRAREHGRERMYPGSATASSAGADDRPAEAAGVRVTVGYESAGVGVPPVTSAPMTSGMAATPDAAGTAGVGTAGSGTGATVPDEYLEYEEDFRTHYDDLYAQPDTRYEDYRPAYHYGMEMARDVRYRDRSWEEVEPDVQREWEATSPGTTWDRFKAAVRHGWDRVTGRHHV